MRFFNALLAPGLVVGLSGLFVYFLSLMLLNKGKVSIYEGNKVILIAEFVLLCIVLVWAVMQVIRKGVRGFKFRGNDRG